MKTKYILVFILSILIALSLFPSGVTLARNILAEARSLQTAVGTGFTYQGYLTEGGSPANGIYDFQFDLYTAENSVEPPLGTVALEDVQVDEGIFTVLLDFGNGAFAGDDRWMEIGVRPGVESGAYTALDGRQQITPAPYALYALEAGKVAWTDVEGRPSGACAPGKNVHRINPDGSVECEPYDTRPVFSLQSVDSVGDYAGEYSSITIGEDGLPIISYKGGNGGLKVAHCDDLACSSASLNTIDSTSDAGNDTSITIGNDGLPIISYIANYSLKVAHCDSPNCNTATITSIVTNSADYGDTSIAIGTDGFALIVYSNYPNNYLKVALCENVACTSSTIRFIDTSNHRGKEPSITIGAEGLPVISYWDATDNQLIVAHCNNKSCTSISKNSVEASGRESSIAIGIDGLPIISYWDNYNDDLKVAHCNNRACATSSISVLDSINEVGLDSSITIGKDGLPVISYYGNTNGNLKVAHCDDIACTSASINAVDQTGSTGMHTAITIGVDGFPVISYQRSDNGTLRVAHCSNWFCVPYWRQR